MQHNDYGTNAVAHYPPWLVHLLRYSSTSSEDEEEDVYKRSPTVTLHKQLYLRRGL